MTSSGYKFIIGAIFIALIGFANEEAAANDAAREENIFYAKNNEKIYLVLSQKEINRIQFLGDKVDSLHYTEGEIEYNPAEEDLYLKVKVEKPVNFFVKVESGKTYQFLVVTSDVPSVQVFVKSKANKIRAKQSNKLKKAEISRKNKILTEYEESIHKIIKVAQAEKPYMGYKFTKVNKNIVPARLEIPNANEKAILITNVLLLKGKGLIAHKIEVTNKSNKEVIIRGEIFERYFSKVVANYVEKDVIKPDEKVSVIVVSEAK